MTRCYQRREDLRLTELGEEGVVLHLGSREYFSVSETGLVILQALDQPRTIEELVAALMNRYEVAEEDARESVEAFLGHCLEEELLLQSDKD